MPVFENLGEFVLIAVVIVINIRSRLQPFQSNFRKLKLRIVQFRASPPLFSLHRTHSAIIVFDDNQGLKLIQHC